MNDPSPGLAVRQPLIIGIEPMLIGIAGGSGSGKTTIAEALLASLPTAVMIQHDSYYRHRPELSFGERTRVNYDHPDSLETELLIDHLAMLSKGAPVDRPTYDFTSHLRAIRSDPIEPAAVIIVEGILVLADRKLREQFDLKIFVDTDADKRLARRLTRDIQERGRTATSVLEQYFEYVRPMYLEFVEPSKAYADVIIPDGYDAAAMASVIDTIRSNLTKRASLTERPPSIYSGSS